MQIATSSLTQGMQTSPLIALILLLMVRIKGGWQIHDDCMKQRSLCEKFCN
jgi:hypothetical protein